MTGRVGVSAKERKCERDTDGQVGDSSMKRGNGRRRKETGT